MNEQTYGPAGGHPDEATLQDHLDGELPPEAADRIRDHLAGCEACRSLFRDLEDLRARARALPSERDPSRDLWPGIEARIRAGAGGERAADSPSLSGSSVPGATSSSEGPPSPSDGATSPSDGPRGADERWRVSPRRGPRERRTGRSGLPSRRFASVAGLAAAAAIAAVAAGTLLFMGDASLPGNGSGLAGGGTEETGEVALATEVRQVEDAYRPAIEELRALADARALSPETRAVLEQNLQVIERAIEESREAVLADPEGHRALESLRRMYDAKVEVLRTVAVLH
jgi:hypothetical protein